MKALWWSFTFFTFLLLGSPSSVAQGTLTNGSLNVICLYSHTLPDDPIIYPSQPGVSMSHDFFGNNSTNAYSTGASLLASPANNCENVADSTGYWAPSLRLANGTVVQPTYQKTYYTNVATPSSNRYPVTAFPAGIQMLAGNHMGTAPNPNVSFLCTGVGYTNTIPTNCVPDPNTGTQLDIGISFPTCWDGINLAPTVMANGYNNMAYPNSSGVCPTGYPVRLPHISFNIAYMLGQVTDLSGAQLSMDPTLNAQGQPIQLNWGTLYTAHADFLDAWQPQAAQFMVTYCLNKGIVCDKSIPYSYSESTADATVIGGANGGTNYGSTSTLLVQSAAGSTPLSESFMQFNIPSGASNFPPSYTPTYKIMIYGGNTSDTTARILYVYATSTSWSESNITMDNAPTCGGSYVGSLYLNNVQQYRTIDVTGAVNSALQAGNSSISFCIAGGNGPAFTFSSKEGANKPVLYLIGDNPSGY